MRDESVLNVFFRKSLLPLSMLFADANQEVAAHGVAWQSITGAGVTVGIVDTDFDLTNPELAGRLTKEVYSRAGNSTDEGFFGGPGTGDSHGTEVAEVLGGRHSGIAPQVQMVGIASGWATHVLLNATINHRLYDQGIRIFNQSNDVGAIDRSTNGATYHDRYAPFVAKGSLFVWATGNRGRLQPSMTAGLPSLYPELQTGWLAVTAVNAIGVTQRFSGGDTSSVISSYANSCGVAANWCLAAPGDFISPSSGQREYGTSFAVPVVSGTLALVQQVYPWMNADLLRQTILSSASRMDDTGAYGWGIVHPARAIKGPTLFAQVLALGPDVHVSFDGMISTFANAIGGDAGLLKDGSGTLILAAKNSYSGRSRIVNGTLNITGSIAAGVQIDRGGQLAGAGGRIGGSVVNHGRLSNTGQGLTIAGDYTATANAILVSDVQTPLKIGGNATLRNSYLFITAPVTNAYVAAAANQPPRTVLRAGNLSGSFGAIGFQRPGVTFSPLLAVRISYAANAVNLHLSRVAMTTAARAFGADHTRINSAANLEQAMLAADAASANLANSGRGSALLTSAAALQRVSSWAALAVALDSLSGQIHASAQALHFQQSQAINRALSDRMALRDSTQRRKPWWGRTFGVAGKLTQTGYASADTSAQGLQFGVDSQLAASTTIGAAVSYAERKASFDRFGGTAKGRHIDFSLYARHAWPVSDVVDSEAYVVARIGAAMATATVSRVAMAGAEVAHLQSQYGDRLFGAYGEAGYGVISTANVCARPFAAIAYELLRRGAFQERGGSFGLQSGNHTYRQLSTVLGLRAAFDVNWLAGRSRIQASAAWQHRLSDGKLDFQAAYTVAPRRNFRVQGIGLPRNTGWSSIAISTAINRRWSWFANYGKQFSGGVRNHMFALGARMVFD